MVVIFTSQWQLLCQWSRLSFDGYDKLPFNVVSFMSMVQAVGRWLLQVTFHWRLFYMNGSGCRWLVMIEDLSLASSMSTVRQSGRCLLPDYWQISLQGH